MAAKAKSHHVAPIYNFFTDPVMGKDVIVMPFFEQQDRFDVKLTSGITPEESARYLSQMCDAAKFVADNNLVHRDFKPENFMIAGGDNLQLTDFGIAKSKEETILDQGEPRFTLPYAPLERIEQQAEDVRSDIYSIGCIAFEMLTGETPFSVPSSSDPNKMIEEMIYLKMTSDGLPDADKQKLMDKYNIPSDHAVIQTIDICLKNSKNARFQTPEELDKAYKSAIHQLPK